MGLHREAALEEQKEDSMAKISELPERCAGSRGNNFSFALTSGSGQQHALQSFQVLWPEIHVRFPLLWLDCNIP